MSAFWFSLCFLLWSGAVSILAFWMGTLHAERRLWDRLRDELENPKT